MSRALLKTAVAATLIVLSSQADARVFNAQTRPGNFTFAGGPVFVPLNTAGSTVASFGIPGTARQRVIISYTAECAVDAAGNATWVDIDILVDGVQVAPPTNAGGNDAFCTSNGTAGFDGWVMAAVNTVLTLRPGPHSVQVRARTSDNVSGGWLSDSSLVIWN